MPESDVSNPSLILLGVVEEPLVVCGRRLAGMVEGQLEVCARGLAGMDEEPLAVLEGAGGYGRGAVGGM